MAAWAGRAAFRAITWAGASDEELLGDLAAKSAGQAESQTKTILYGLRCRVWGRFIVREGAAVL